MKPRGIALILIAITIPLFWTIPLAQQHNAAGVYSQYFGIVSLILMGITQLIATRVSGIEAIFGSLDRAYVLHKWLGVGALVMAFLHDNIDAEAGNIALVRGLSDGAEDIGDLAYKGILYLTIASLITIIPYKYWKWSHRFIGIFFALAAYHYIYIEKPYAVFDFPGLYTTAFCLIGVASYLYLLLPRMLGHNTRAYKVSSVIQHDDVTEVNLETEGAGITHKAGQFAFIHFDPVMLREPHPYTISSAPREDGSLRFLIKGLGSYTKRLGTSLEPGTTARVSNAYGHFSLKPTDGPQVWIGGGIGITPFMAWAQALPDDWSTPIHLYYCVRNRKDAIYVEEFEAIANRIKSFNFKVVASKEGKRLNADQIAQVLGTDVNNAHAYFCGPSAMRESLRHGLYDYGLPINNFHNEEFEMRTSIGIVRFARNMINYLTPSNKTPINKPSTA